MEEWEEYFRGLLGGIERRVVRREKRRQKGKEKEQKRGKIKQVLECLKENKTAKTDEISAEVWKFGEKRMIKWKDGRSVEW